MHSSPSHILMMQVSMVSQKSSTVILSGDGLNPSLADFPVTVAAEAGLFHSSVLWGKFM